MFQHQKDLARLNAELRGYATPGAAYGLNAAGRPPSNNTGSDGSSVGPNNPVLTAGTLNPGNSGLGYGEPRAQAKIKQNSGASTNFGTTPGTSANLSNLNADIQPFEHRSTGAARNIADSDADKWLNQSILKASSRALPVKPASHGSTGVASAGGRSTSAAAGPAGAVAGLLADEADKSIKSMRGGLGSASQAFATKLFN